MTQRFVRPDLDLVLFDMDDVLAHYDVSARVAALAQATGRSPGMIRSSIWGSDYFPRADSGEWDAQRCLEEFSSRIGARVTRDVWVATRKLSLRPFPEMIALVGRLKASGVAVGLLSNNCLLTLETLDEIFPGLPKLMGPHCYVSAQFRLHKPDPRLFRVVCERIGVRKRRAMFVDDLVENVEGARAAGMIGHVFAGAAALEAAFMTVRERDECA